MRPYSLKKTLQRLYFMGLYVLSTNLSTRAVYNSEIRFAKTPNGSQKLQTRFAETPNWFAETPNWVRKNSKHSQKLQAKSLFFKG